MRFLADSRRVSDHWYPRDLRKRAKVNAYLDQHHSFLRQGVHSYIYKKYLSPLIVGKTYTDEELAIYITLLKRTCKMLERQLE